MFPIGQNRFYIGAKTIPTIVKSFIANPLFYSKQLQTDTNMRFCFFVQTSFFVFYILKVKWYCESEVAWEVNKSSKPIIIK